MKRFAIVAIVVLAIATGWHIVRACGPDFPRAVFSYLRHPDVPRTEFVDGRLGVLQPTFARSYLVIAYRHLNGIGLNEREREQARDYYADRETQGWDRIGTDWAERWHNVRAQVSDPSVPRTMLITKGKSLYDPETHSFVLNCADDAFRNAVHTFEARRAQFGATSVALRSWLAAQDAVFHNCDSTEPSIPAPAADTLPPLIRADRDYQIAAAHFYAGHHVEARDRFRRIARDPSSPWATISRYLVARTLLRMSGDQERAVEAGGELRVEATSILEDERLSTIHGMTHNLLERAGLREHDRAYFRQLALLATSREQDNGLREELWNYVAMFDHMVGDNDPNPAINSSREIKLDPAPFRDADLSDWILSFQWQASSVYEHALERWRATSSPAWLLAALSHANAEQARRDALFDAANALPARSPGYLTAQFHLVRLAIEVGERRAAREQTDALLAGDQLQGLPSSVNLFRGLRMLAAPTLEEFVAFAVRKPVLVTFDTNTGESIDYYRDDQRLRHSATAALFDSDATRILNYATPFRALKRVALGSQLPVALRKQALLTAFTRGLMLNEDLTEIAKALSAAEPAVAPYAKGYLSETTAEGKRFAAAFLLLHRPEARPYFVSGIARQSRPGRLDPYRDNWWCPVDVQQVLEQQAESSEGYPIPQVSRLQVATATQRPEFLRNRDVDETARELARLGQLSAATDFLGAIVFHYEKSHHGDARIPESLHWLVRAGHYGCADTNTWKVTRASFRLLQLSYGDTEWARRTPTWFKNDYGIRSNLPEKN